MAKKKYNKNGIYGLEEKKCAVCGRRSSRHRSTFTKGITRT